MERPPRGGLSEIRSGVLIRLMMAFVVFLIQSDCNKWKQKRRPSPPRSPELHRRPGSSRSLCVRARWNRRAPRSRARVRAAIQVNALALLQLSKDVEGRTKLLTTNFDTLFAATMVAHTLMVVARTPMAAAATSSGKLLSTVVGIASYDASESAIESHS